MTRAEDLLLEIGVEELPASFVREALSAMPELLTSLLEAANLARDASRPIRALGTPRRLALWVPGLSTRTQEVRQTVVGPPKRVAVADDGSWTKAALGFAKKNGVSEGDLRLESVEGRGGEYVVVRRTFEPEPAGSVLAARIPGLVAQIPFRKSMRWGDGDMAFGRPIHWIVALHGDQVIELELAGVRAGRTTYGHRFLAPEPIELGHASEYEGRLAGAHVIVDPDVRRAHMREALDQAARRLGGVLVEDEFLMQECVSLVEEPFVVPGRFDEEFLKLPEAVVVSVMRDHQRYFAVRGLETGRLLPRYLNVVNTANDPETVARNNDRVLRARLADARFFVREDLKKPLESRVAELDRVVFQNELGSLGQKVARVADLTELLGAGVSGYDAAKGRQAARLCKVDLVTLIVGEFPELQGEMGRFYALEEGVDAEVADAVRDHYLPRGASDAVPGNVVGAVLGVADRIDTLVGFFGVGLSTSGSADPYGLRRAALGVVRTALEGPIDVRLAEALRHAYRLYDGARLAPEEDVLQKLDAFFRARLRAHYRGSYPADVAEACLGAWDGDSCRDLDARMRAVNAFRERPEFESLSVAFKRTFNIAKDAPAGEPDPTLLQEDAERALAEQLAASRPAIREAVDAGDYDRALKTVARDLRDPIDRFFDDVFVMVEDDRLRQNRLRLLGGIARVLTDIAHFHQLST
ncbi:MAG: glycine--tRNA ligase subunit beta [Myxococcota bacterium]